MFLKTSHKVSRISDGEISQKTWGLLPYKEELMAVARNGTWELKDLPDGKNAISQQWAFQKS